MASNPPFELEDQTDEDFFDKLVDDDGEIDVNVSVNATGGGGLKSVGSLPDVDEISDGDESDEAKAFAKLSLSDSFETKAVEGCDGNVVVQQIVGAKDQVLVEGNLGTDSLPSLDFSSFDHGSVSKLDLSSRGENSGSVSGDASFGEQRVEEKELQGVYGGDVIQSSMPPGSFSFENGHGSNDEVAASEAKSSLRRENSGSMGSGVKEVQWGNFSESGKHRNDGFGSYSDFFSNLGEGGVGNIQDDVNSGYEASKTTTATENLFSYSEFQSQSGTVSDQTAVVEDNAQDWDNLYPGWKYDPNTGQWYQCEQENLNAAAGNVLYGDSSYQGSSDVQSYEVSHAQQAAQLPLETISQLSTSETVSGWNHISRENGEHQYPAHMFLDPQYPGWYYDTIAQEWCSLNDYYSSDQSTYDAHNQQFQNESLSTTYYHHGDSQGNSNAYQVPTQSTDQAHNQPFQNGSFSTADYYQGDSQTSNALQSHTSEGLNQTLATSFANYGQQGTNVHQPNVTLEKRSWESSYDPNLYSNSHANQSKSFDSWDTRSSFEKTPQSGNTTNWADRSQSFIPSGGAFQQFSPNLQGQRDGPIQHSTDYYGGQNTASNPQPFFANAQHVPSGQSEGRSSAGRPPHALVTFGFGGKLVIMKDNTRGFSPFGSKDPDGCSISVCNLMEVVSVNNGPIGTGTSTCSYFNSLCHQSFPGPFVGGNAGSKELNRWIDERITNCELMDMDYCKSKAMKLLLSLLKVACQHYGKLRSYGADTGMMESDLPESAVAKLFASAKSQCNEYGATAKCFMALPSEAQIQTTAIEVQQLLISGRKKEALERAQEGQLWEFALILARQLGEQFYADTVKQMAISQLVLGSPLRTLCLLIAKKPEEVFSNNVVAANNMPGNIHMPQPAQNVGYSMLDNWEENLAVITANRTENDQLVIIHLGDCLWKEKNDVTAAHICYLIADADLESYSDSARLCLIGANHLSFPRTYASPEAIQRTEFFEYTKALGNSQFVLLSLQPYKLLYAHMLAEVGRVSDSLKYCQAISKSLKTGRSQEAGTLKQLLTSLEDRIKTYQQSGYAVNLAPGKIVGKLLNFIDSTAHRVVGGLPPPAPLATQSGFQGSEHNFHTVSSKVPGNQSAMNMPSLTPSASMEPISQWAVDGSRMTLQNRSSSEPDIGRTPKSDQTDAANEATSSSREGKQSGTIGTSRFGRFNFGASIFQKTVGLVLKPRQGNQAKLGDTNKFYYDEKLKRWVEEGAEAPKEEPALAPPPTITSFQSGTSDYNMNSSVYDQFPAASRSPEPSISTPLGSSSGIPAMPPSSNQFSARARMGVRSRYVDTFNKGGTGSSVASTNLFNPPTAPSAKPASAAKFFVPTAAPSMEQTSGTESISPDESSGNAEIPSMPMAMNNDPFQNLTPSPAGNIQRFPSFDNISNKAAPGIQNNNNGSNGSFAPSHSRRTSSWSDIHSSSSFSPPPTTTETRTSPLAFTPSGHSGAPLPRSGRSFGDDLQEVEL